LSRSWCEPAITAPANPVALPDPPRGALAFELMVYHFIRALHGPRDVAVYLAAAACVARQ